MIAISFTLVALVGMGFLGLSLYLRFASSVESVIKEDNKRVLDQVNMNLDVYLRNMMRVSDTMYYHVIKNTDLSTGSVAQQMGLLYETNRDMLVSIVLLDEDGESIAAYPLSMQKPGVRPAEQPWFVQATEKIENLHFSEAHVQNLFEDPDYNYRWVVSLSRAVELTRGGVTSRGVLLVDMNFSGIDQIFSNVALGETGYVYLMNRSGEIIYHPRQQLLYANIIQENNLRAVDYEDGNHEETFGGTKRIVTVKTVGYTGWKIVGVTPVENFTTYFYDMQEFAVYILAFTMFLMIFANFFVSSRIADPITALDRSVRKLERGDLEAEIAIGGSYEIRHLGMSIRQMVAQMRKLMDDIVTEQESKRKSELDALQSQINPHFLYNTLDSTVWMIENERYSEAVRMITALARLFRISLSKGANIISVENEFDHARNYLAIQEMRYTNRFTVDIDLSDEVRGLSCIKLIIQPILENSIYHGLEFMDGDGEITLRARTEGDELIIDVSDNGCGIPEPVLETLLVERPQVKSKSKGSGIALRNVHRRIQVYYGEKYGLEIQSEPDEGTTVRIHLPAIPYEAAPKPEVRP
ncbi:MAG: sensor histidine kinase [Oscillospiraceae bacterium]|nr:sensor histidine kinase [Oscillospiraceae bacterium]